MSIATAASPINVPFYGAELYVVSVDSEAFTPMRPIIDGMGLTYQGQADKLKSRFAKGVREIMIPTKGGEQTMLCLALRKLNGWLQTISPNKVRPEIRDRVIQYQEECDDVLYEYWTKGEVKNPRKSGTTVDDRTPLRGLVNRIMGKTGIHYQPLYKMIHREFGVNHIDELTPKQVAEAMEYLAGKVLEGEFLPKDNNPIPFQSAMPLSGSGRTMIYTDEKGVVQGSYPLTEDQVVMSFDGFVKFFRGKGWLVAPKEEVIGAIQSLQ